MTIRALFLACAFLFSAASANAQVTSGLSYYHVDNNGITLGALVGSFGVEIPINDSLSIIPEFRGGVGVKNDTVEGVKIELESVLSAVVRFEVLLTESFYLHVSPSYGRYQAKASASFAGVSAFVRDSSYDFGIGGGLGFRIGPHFSLEAGYENIDGLDVIQIGSRYRF